MRTFEQLEQAWQDSDVPGKSGTVRLLVARLGAGQHDVPSSARLTLDEGLVGDRWKDGSAPNLERQLTLMEHRVAELVCDGQPLDRPGDNLLVDLDLSVASAPAGTQIRLGQALVEVSAVPHTGCAKFVARFGADAMRWVNAEEFSSRRMRGINCRVLEPGVVTVGDPAQIIRREA